MRETLTQKVKLHQFLLTVVPFQRLSNTSEPLILICPKGQIKNKKIKIKSLRFESVSVLPIFCSKNKLMFKKNVIILKQSLILSYSSQNSCEDQVFFVLFFNLRFEFVSVLLIFCPKNIAISKKKVFTLNLFLIFCISDLQGEYGTMAPLNTLLLLFHPYW